LRSELYGRLRDARHAGPAHDDAADPRGDVAGIVREVGQNVSADWVGKRVVLFPRFPEGGVLGEHGNGGLCEFIAVDKRQLIAIPDGVDFDAAAALRLPMARRIECCSRAVM